MEPVQERLIAALECVRGDLDMHMHSRPIPETKRAYAFEFPLYGLFGCQCCHDVRALGTIHPICLFDVVSAVGQHIVVYVPVWVCVYVCSLLFKRPRSCYFSVA